MSSQSHGNGESSGRESHQMRARDPEKANQTSSSHGGVCTFFLGEKQYGLDVSLVGEVVSITDVAPIPMSPTSVRGIFSLRGTPVALLDFGDVLALEGGRIREAKTALVVRRDDLLVGFVIDRMEAVVPDGRGVFTDASAEDHAAVRGFLELDDARGVVTVIDPRTLLERIEATRFLKTED